MSRVRSVVAITLALAATATVALAASGGELDPTFGDGGTVTTDFGVGFDGASGAAIDSEGRVIVVGSALPRPNDHEYADTVGAVARFLPNGEPDSSFGEDGVARTDLGAIDQGFTAVTIDARGRVLAAGYSGWAAGDEDTYASFALARYLPNGTLDDSFNGDGKTTRFAGTGGFNVLAAIATDTRGRIVAAGATGGPNSRAAVLRVLPDGGRDGSFGERGLSLPFHGGGGYSDLVLRPGGVIDLIGYREDGNFINQLAVSRLSRHGEPIRGFGRRGTKTFPGALGTRSVGNAAALDGDGRLVIAGFTSPIKTNYRTKGHAALIRMRPGGKLDHGFGRRGVVIPKLGGDHETATAVRLDSRGRIVVGEYTDRSEEPDFALLRRRRNGKPDTSFGTEGRVFTDLSGGSAILEIVIDSEGRILAGGVTEQKVALARYRP